MRLLYMLCCDPDLSGGACHGRCGRPGVHRRRCRRAHC